MTPPSASVIVPTLGRPASLERALRSVMAQSRTDGMELIVVDNDPARSAEAIVRRLAEGAPFPLRYVSEPSLGVANARNAGVSAAEGAFIAFLDDDESAPPTWLQSLLAVQVRTDAAVVFGPVRAVLPPGTPGDTAYLERFFSRTGPASSGVIDHYHGCGNCLIRRSALPDPVQPFSPTRNRIGGEDDLLFATMRAAGARLAWAAEAWVNEHVPPERATVAYTLRRAFAFGQGPSSASAAAGPRSWPMVPVWMGVGLSQAVVFGALSAWKAARGRQVASTLDRAVQGLGKLLWFPPFKLALYGQTPKPSLP